MFSSSSRSWFAGPPEPNGDAAWDVLDRFIRGLHDADRPYNLRKVALRAICEATGATVGLTYRSATSTVVELVGQPEHLGYDWPTIARQLLIQVPAGGLCLRSSLRGVPQRGGLVRPASAAVVRVDRDHSEWVIVASFDPTRPLRASDSKVIAVLWRLQLGQTRQTDASTKLKETFFGTVRCLASVVDARVPFSQGSSERVARVAVGIGRELGFASSELSNIYLAGLLHDIGMLSIPEAIISKPGPLTPEEEARLHQHPVLAEEVLAPSRRLAYLLPIIRGHHERPDGTGYPDRLIGKAIPIAARVLAVADAAVALASVRPNRPALTPLEVEATLRAGAGSQWDPDAVAAVLARCERVLSLCRDQSGAEDPIPKDPTTDEPPGL